MEKNIGSTLESILKEEGCYEDAQATAVKRVIAFQLEKIMKEQRLSLSGAIDENSAAEVGKLLGLNILIIGNASYSHNDEWSNSDFTGRCLKRIVTAKGTMKIISVETAQIVGTKTASASFKDSGCGDKVSGVMKTDQLADVCLKQLSKEFVDYDTF